MIRLSLTDLVDIVSKSGTPKATKVRQVKLRPDYEPAHDFYKPLRDLIIEIHKKGKPKQELDKIAGYISDKKKIESYPRIIQGYKKWWGCNTFQWIEPPRSAYTANGVEIIVNPELGLKFGKENHVIKLYFKSDPLSKFKSDIITNLMEIELRTLKNENVKMSVLDIRNAKLFTCSGTPVIKLVIDAELAYIASLWLSTQLS